MNFTVASIISCLDSTSKTAKPPTTSLVSVKGPSITVTFPCESRTRLLIAVGASPPASNIVPSFAASSLSFAMASISAGGGGPEFSADFTRVMNRIITSPFGLYWQSGHKLFLPGSTHKSNERLRDQHNEDFFVFLCVLLRLCVKSHGFVTAQLAKASHAKTPSTQRKNR